jgi:hypothetical protein
MPKADSVTSMMGKEHHRLLDKTSLMATVTLLASDLSSTICIFFNKIAKVAASSVKTPQNSL